MRSTNKEFNEEMTNRNNELSLVNHDLIILNNIGIPVLILDNELKIRNYTDSAVKLFNLMPNDIGRKITTINNNLIIDNLESLINEIIKTSTTKEIQTKDNLNNLYLIKIGPYINNEICGAIITCLDISILKGSMNEVSQRTRELQQLNESLNNEIQDRKIIEESLRILSKHLVTAQENERQRLSRELHDSIIQILSVVKMKLYSAVKNKNDDIDVRDAKELLERAISEIRIVTKNLRPVLLDDFGLNSAIKSTIDDFSSRTKIKVKFETGNLRLKFSPEIELHIYRIIQEALNNIEKHSKADKVTIKLLKVKNQIKLSIKDNGKGFILHKNLYSNLKKDKFGLISMKERVQSFDGNFAIITSKTGTEIEIIIPINASTKR